MDYSIWLKFIDDVRHFDDELAQQFRPVPHRVIKVKINNRINILSFWQVLLKSKWYLVEAQEILCIFTFENYPDGFLVLEAF